MGKQKAAFDQLFPTYTYTVYYYKLLQRSRTYLSSWHWSPVAVGLLYVRKANCECWAHEYVWFTHEKTTDYSFYSSLSAGDGTRCLSPPKPATRPPPVLVLLAAPQGVQTIAGAINKEQMRVNYWKAVWQEELLSLLSLPRRMELHRRHDTWANKSTTMIGRACSSTVFALLCAKYATAPWASCISLFLKNQCMILSKVTREEMRQKSLHRGSPSVPRLIEKDVTRLRVLWDIWRQPVEFFNSLCIYFFYNIVIKQ